MSESGLARPCFLPEAPNPRCPPPTCPVSLQERGVPALLDLWALRSTSDAAGIKTLGSSHLMADDMSYGYTHFTEGKTEPRRAKACG